MVQTGWAPFVSPDGINYRATFRSYRFLACFVSSRSGGRKLNSLLLPRARRLRPLSSAPASGPPALSQLGPVEAFASHVVAFGVLAGDLGLVTVCPCSRL